jgi:hypothetical protein
LIQASDRAGNISKTLERGHDNLADISKFNPSNFEGFVASWFIVKRAAACLPVGTH